MLLMIVTILFDNYLKLKGNALLFQPEINLVLSASHSLNNWVFEITTFVKTQVYNLQTEVVLFVLSPILFIFEIS